MFATDLVNESVLSYPVRRLQQTTSYVFIYLGMYLSCLVMVFGLIIVIIRSFSTPGSVAALDTTTEFPTDNNTLHKTSRMSTLAERKQAILELFESAQVTMVSNDYTLIGRRHFIDIRKLTTTYFVDTCRKYLRTIFMDQRAPSKM
jgi:hypothetical protein